MDSTTKKAYGTSSRTTRVKMWPKVLELVVRCRRVENEFDKMTNSTRHNNPCRNAECWLCNRLRRNAKAPAAFGIGGSAAFSDDPSSQMICALSRNSQSASLTLSANQTRFYQIGCCDLTILSTRTKFDWRESVIDNLVNTALHFNSSTLGGS